MQIIEVLTENARIQGELIQSIRELKTERQVLPWMVVGKKALSILIFNDAKRPNVQFVDKLIKEAKIPYSKIGKSYIFFPLEVEKAIKEHYTYN